jgi:endonuclease/exonuclease/phosphatase family metal-dependent hydrolase
MGNWLQSTSKIAIPQRYKEWIDFALPTLTVTLGLSMLRALLPLIVYVLRDRIGWEAYEVGLLAFMIFASSFLVAHLQRVLGSPMALLTTAAGVGMARLGMQIWSWDPIGDLFLAIVGTVLFIYFLPCHLVRVRTRGPEATGHYGLAVLLALSLDTAILGGFGTYSVVLQDGWVALTLVTILVLFQLASLVTHLSVREAPGKSQACSDTNFSCWQVLPWVAIGSLFFLQIMIFQNTARLAALTGWNLPAAFGWVVLANAFGLVGAVQALTRWRSRFWLGTALLGCILIICVSLNEQNALVEASTIMTGQILASIMLVMIFSRLGVEEGRSKIWIMAIAHGVAMISLTALLFGYFVSYDLELPFDNASLMPLAGLIVGGSAVVSSMKFPTIKLSAGIRFLPPLLGFCLMTIPLGLLLTWDTPKHAGGDGFPVRVMTYNLHNGFGTNGALEMEELARVIEVQMPDIVALQEVSRGWAINGSMDMLEWLSQRLKMPYIYGATTGPLWGNAILTRYPVLEFQEVSLPPRSLPLLRGFLWARLDIGDGQQIHVINTHFHHLEEDGKIRENQSRVLLKFMAGTNQTVLMGDLNASPFDDEIALLQRAGLKDALAEIIPGYTYPSDDPTKRLDYIMVTQDLTAEQPMIPYSTASDHLPVVANISE